MGTLLSNFALQILHTPEPCWKCKTLLSLLYIMYMDPNVGEIFVIHGIKVPGIAVSKCWCSTAPGDWCRKVQVWGMMLRECCSSHFERCKSGVGPL